MNQFADSTMDRITRYLIHSHKTKNSEHKVAEEKANYEIKSSIPKQKTIKPNIQSDHSCSKCHSKNTNITHGRFGYYFKCGDCEGNTFIKLKCKNDSCKPRLRKAKNNFHHECSSCGASHLYYTNKSTESV